MTENGNNSKDEFENKLLDFIKSLENELTEPNGDWKIKGFIDTNNKIYTISSDTKVLSKIIELTLMPKFFKFAKENNYELILAKHQNHYPDLTFIRDEVKFAVDIKSTYRKNGNDVNGMTLGAFTGYFRNRTSTKNIRYPYDSYNAHYVFGMIYTRNENADEMVNFDYSKIDKIKPVISDFNFFIQEKYKIATGRPGSGNTKNIGSVTNINDLINGNGPFSTLGEDVFNNYWTSYMTSDMARSAGKTIEFKNLVQYLELMERQGKKDDPS